VEFPCFLEKIMFEKIKKIKQLRDIQKSLKEEKVEMEKDGLRIVLNGKLELLELNLNPEKSFSEQEEILKQLFNQAIREIQVKISHKLSQFSGWGL